MLVMASNKKINIPFSGTSSDQICALLDAIDNEGKEDIENLLNGSDTEFIDQSAVENGDVDRDLSPIKNRKETERRYSNFNTN